MDENERRQKMRAARRRAVRRQQLKKRIIAGGILLLVIIIMVIVGVVRCSSGKSDVSANQEETWKAKKLYVKNQPQLDVELLDINKYSRPGTALPAENINGIVVHYTANPGTTARQNRDYFNGLAESHETYASAHFVIGLDGEIVQCIPCNEIAYASNDRNEDTIAIECCIEDDSGKFNDKTYGSLVHLVTWLMGRYDLDTESVIRHYDVTGKNCPKYFVEYEDAWIQFKDDLNTYILENGVEKTE